MRSDESVSGRRETLEQLDFHSSFCNSAASCSQYAEVAQLVEHSPEKAGVDSSILSLGTNLPRTYKLLSFPNCPQLPIAERRAPLLPVA